MKKAICWEDDGPCVQLDELYQLLTQVKKDIQFVIDSKWMGYASTLIMTHGNLQYEGTTLKDIIDKIDVLLGENNE